jgi:hypothetical protein
MTVSFTFPDHMELKGLYETKRGWMVYLGPRGSNYLQGMIGGTPQEAADLAAARVQSYLDMPKPSPDNRPPRNAEYLTVDDLF